mmetsp:Transcript_5738/g.5214  ORF Transcript_5738/g.5214 Transcript_5738/m.5214 type:complete len:129 (-) Transcript_5738:146-532(-)|eukprot:CAMPEP_0170559690 /NCGR_PEP_ID=MMETSP0211-20121228/44479_1 /TAXON_ID=311385 /ORGANISM="Pseudokeronopsis sp., Strain OXSARD2" /LENGTH=128 /DNA_ID=CAMNT_0010873047 /DNA_START=161 /DNA_END=547 /DNA_ORIENTATION=-
MGSLKNEDWLVYLSELASTQIIKFIISVDNIKSGIFWNEQVLDKFNFFNVQLDTYLDYDLEGDFMPPLFSAKNDNQEVGLSFILKSMTEHQQKVIKLIAEHQLQNINEKGIKPKELLNKCVESMLAYN